MSTDGPPFTCPSQARAALDRLEAAIGAEGPDLQGAREDLHGDWVPEIPGSGEPPD
ncbi:hypothetical protein [Nocardioides sp. URHA0020]|uniref:hypothetical protein n=1 Tax=Nocardioides sp. URHA0020 TaxID=1380392 RepID=UPI000B14B809|nr:hypothetical protein [Nocardioides sp. URHA0020]